MSKVLIIGCGPAGMFCAYELARLGISVRIIDSGKPLLDRKCPQDSACNCSICDILEGEGGAGGFSDGKNTYSLSRGTQMETLFKPEDSVILEQIEDMMRIFGPEGVREPFREPFKSTLKDTDLIMETYNLQHIGSDGIRDFICRFGKTLRSAYDVEMVFETEALNIEVSSDRVLGVELEGYEDEIPESFSFDYLVSAVGLQGSPWMEEQMLNLGYIPRHGPAGMGIRLETQAKILDPLFDIFYDFKIHLPGRIPVRSFCCNRRGFVINENHRRLGIQNVNGHSYLDENMKSWSSNFALMAKIEVDEMIALNPQYFVRLISKEINTRAGGTAIESVESFLGNSSVVLTDSHVRTNVKAQPFAIHEVFPSELLEAYRDFILAMEKVVPGIICPDTFIYAPEMKYFGHKMPVNLETWRSEAYENLYIIGNASGYLDSFVSAALTGIKAAKDIKKKEGIKDA